MINLHERDENLLNLIKKYFGDAGTLGKSRGCSILKVRSLNSIVTKIIPHFDKYPLATDKLADYLL